MSLSNSIIPMPSLPPISIEDCEPAWVRDARSAHQARAQAKRAARDHAASRAQPRRRRGPLTVLLVPDDGLGARSLSLPAWTARALGLCVAGVLGLSGVTGFQLEARYGLRGPRAMQLAAQHDHAERWSFYERLPLALRGSTPAERRRYAAMMHAFQLGLGNRQAASELWAGEPEPEWVEEASRGVSSYTGTLLWPVRAGMFGRGFGSGPNGYHLAVDIDGPRGSPVLAAAPGVVGYASNELRGYGTLVLLVHPGGFVTLYAHNQRVLVVPGEHVRQGQPIAELGSTGHSMGPHVHFELIHDGHNCDPLPLFRPTVPNFPAWMPPIRRAQWMPDEARPKGLRCERRQDHPHPRRDYEELKTPEDDEGGEPLLSANQGRSPLALAR